jgi:hypothetical protein
MVAGGRVSGEEGKGLSSMPVPSTITGEEMLPHIPERDSEDLVRRDDHNLNLFSEFLHKTPNNHFPAFIG